MNYRVQRLALLVEVLIISMGATQTLVWRAVLQLQAYVSVLQIIFIILARGNVRFIVVTKVIVKMIRGVTVQLVVPI